MIRPSSWRFQHLALVAVLALATAACGGGGGGQSSVLPTSGGGATSSAGGQSTSPPPSTGSSAATSGGGGQSTSPPPSTADGDASSASNDPGGPDFVLWSLPECSVVPGGALGGGDGLTMFVALRNAGPGTWSKLVSFRLTSDTGLQGGGNSAISTGSSTTGMQATLRPGDYGRAHRFTIVADPDNAVRERDESNNQLVITVTLPGRSSTTTDVPCTSP